MTLVLSMPAETGLDLAGPSAPDPNVLTTFIAGGVHVSPLRFAPLREMRSGQTVIYSRDLDNCWSLALPLRRALLRGGAEGAHHPRRERPGESY
jgi:hypothetical protein